MKSRTGRGRLSSLDLLPDHAEEVVQEALGDLRERRKLQKDILATLNFRLAALDPPVEPVSKSAFNRFTMRFAMQARRLTEAREAAAAMAERLEDMPEGDVGLLLGETIKALLNDALIDGMLTGESPSIPALREASDALYRLERARLDNVEAAKRRERFVQKAADAVENAVREKGLSAETVQSIRAEILGVRGG